MTTRQIHNIINELEKDLEILEKDCVDDITPEYERTLGYLVYWQYELKERIATKKVRISK